MKINEENCEKEKIDSPYLDALDNVLKEVDDTFSDNEFEKHILIAKILKLKIKFYENYHAIPVLQMREDPELLEKLKKLDKDKPDILDRLKSIGLL